MDTNLKGAFFCAQAAARLMIPEGYGRIINIASQMALVGATNRAAYCASKGGLLNLTRVLALEWAQHGITVNAIGPGPTLTPGVLEAEEQDDARSQEGAEHAAQRESEFAVKMPLGRRMDPEELVGAAIYLASAVGGGDDGADAGGGWRLDGDVRTVLQGYTGWMQDGMIFLGYCGGFVRNQDSLH